MVWQQSKSGVAAKEGDVCLVITYIYYFLIKYYQMYCLFKFELIYSKI